MLGFKAKKPQDRIRIADKKIQCLRSNKIEIEIAKAEMSQPVKKTTNISTQVTLNKTDKSKSIHFHGHYHNNKKK